MTIPDIELTIVRTSGGSANASLRVEEAHQYQESGAPNEHDDESRYTPYALSGG
jgi:hypothetical protein